MQTSRACAACRRAIDGNELAWGVGDQCYHMRCWNLVEGRPTEVGDLIPDGHRPARAVKLRFRRQRDGAWVWFDEIAEAALVGYAPVCYSDSARATQLGGRWFIPPHMSIARHLNYHRSFAWHCTIAATVRICPDYYVLGIAMDIQKQYMMQQLGYRRTHAPRHHS